MSETCKKRLTDLGLKIGFLPCGKHNNITDVPGVKVGHASIVSGDGVLKKGTGPVRTGVTLIIPHSGNLWQDRPSAGFFALNGCGVVTGSDWINESGALEGPIALTNSHSVGDVGSALTRLMAEMHPEIGTTGDAYLPVVGECDDSPLNDINGFHVKDEHVRDAFAKAASGFVEEGAVGAGVGMTCFGFKGGIGSASRLVGLQGKTYTVAALVNSNHGQTEQLTIKGVPVGQILSKELKTEKNKEGSIVIILATDAPLNQRQLERLSKRACLGLARTGAIAANGSGDFVLSFSTGRRVARESQNPFLELRELHSDYINPFFQAAAEATEEAVLNSLFCANTIRGRDENESKELPVTRVLELLSSYKFFSA